MNEDTINQDIDNAADAQLDAADDAQAEADEEDEPAEYPNRGQV